jgi:hypothetical protein
MAAKVVFFSSDFVDASPETVQVLEGWGWRPRWSSSAVALWRPALKHWGLINAENGHQGGLLQQRLCGGLPWNIGVFVDFCAGF